MVVRQRTVLQIVNFAMKEIGLTQVNIQQAVGSLDKNVTQMVALMNATAEEILMDQPYEEVLGDGLWLVEPSNGALRALVESDTQLVLIDSRVFTDNLKARFLSANGLEYAESMRDYATRINKLASRANRRVLDLDSDEGRLQ